MSWDDFMGPDRLHPNDRGHQLMADMVIYLLQQTAVDLLLRPVTLAEVAASRAPLPPPMYDGEGWRAPGGTRPWASCDPCTRGTRVCRPSEQPAHRAAGQTDPVARGIRAFAFCRWDL
jgi:hypothetical protein